MITRDMISEYCFILFCSCRIHLPLLPGTPTPSQINSTLLLLLPLYIEQEISCSVPMKSSSASVPLRWLLLLISRCGHLWFTFRPLTLVLPWGQAIKYHCMHNTLFDNTYVNTMHMRNFFYNLLTQSFKVIFTSVIHVSGWYRTMHI